MKMEFPIKYVEDNLVFGRDKTVWAFFKIEGFSYDFLDHDEKMYPFQEQMAFLTNNSLDLHYLVIPNPTNIEGILNASLEEIEYKDYGLKEQGISYMNQVKKILEKEKKINETSEYNHYIGIQLDPTRNKYESSNIGLNIISDVKNFLKGFTSPVFKVSGLEVDDILESEIEAYKQQMEVIYANSSNSFYSPIKKINSDELLYVIEKTFSTRNNNTDVIMRKNFEIGNKIHALNDENEDFTAIRTSDKDFLDLQKANITEENAKTLKLSRITDELKEESLFVQYLVVSEMEDIKFHPNNEWLYRIQSRMPFPVTISIRADIVPNEKVKKRLSNVRLDYKDQKKEAEKASDSSDLSVQKAEQGAIKMESYFQETGFPAYSCRIIFKVTGKTKNELEVRASRLQKELTKFDITVQSPYGEQIQLLLSTLPSYKRTNEDYAMTMAPSALASVMFGATTNIGDNRGFYIGQTSKFGKPVFIQPDLAAKAYEGLGAVVSSLSVLVAGMTGKGKSFFMNLFVYLSVLNGSSALIIDPKGDRKGWDNGLPYIDKRFSEVWTLGEKAEDAGSLDPFRTSTNIQEAKDVTMDILSYLANIEIDNDSYSILSEAVEKASVTKEPCVQEVINYLNELFVNKPKGMSGKRYEDLESLVSTLETLKRNKLSMLLFGEPGQNYKVLEHSKPLQVLMIQNLNLPTEETKAKRISHKISEAIMISITAWTKQYMFSGDRAVHKIILQDEASAIEQNPMGAELMDFIVRQGRYYNTTLLKGSQNATDHGSNVANMGMKFSFGLQYTDEAEEMLKFLNLPVTAENIKILKRLDTGEALFQDIFGRSAIIRINPIFNDLFDAFDSSTSTKEEKERHKNIS